MEKQRAVLTCYSVNANNYLKNLTHSKTVLVGRIIWRGYTANAFPRLSNAINMEVQDLFFI